MPRYTIIKVEKFQQHWRHFDFEEFLLFACQSLLRAFLAAPENIRFFVRHTYKLLQVYRKF
jgi:hypothetical protein